MKHEMEQNAMKRIVDLLPNQKLKNEVMELYQEYETQSSAEAR